MLARSTEPVLTCPWRSETFRYLARGCLCSQTSCRRIRSGLTADVDIWSCFPVAMINRNHLASQLSLLVTASAGRGGVGRGGLGEAFPRRQGQFFELESHWSLLNGRVMKTMGCRGLNYSRFVPELTKKDGLCFADFWLFNMLTYRLPERNIPFMHFVSVCLALTLSLFILLAHYFLENFLHFGDEVRWVPRCFIGESIWGATLHRLSSNSHFGSTLKWLLLFLDLELNGASVLFLQTLNNC